jgi:hypothetical protein
MAGRAFAVRMLLPPGEWAEKSRDQFPFRRSAQDERAQNQAGSVTNWHGTALNLPQPVPQSSRQHLHRTKPVC